MPCTEMREVAGDLGFRGEIKSSVLDMLSLRFL